MTHEHTTVPSAGLIDMAGHRRAFTPLPVADHLGGPTQSLSWSRLSRAPGAGTPGGMVPSDDELLERTLTFSGSYVSDDGHVRIRRAAGVMEYSGARFTGYCAVCAHAGRTPPTGEPLRDVRAALQFAATHDHGDAD
jgi:hypothetical protein